ncbi:MAG TPA: hypothetical protein PKL77_05690 [Candidatus Omnitrophota bacterium]|nr:hypothetical protein [Candidatus Omnitrophota bacterium]
MEHDSQIQEGKFFAIISYLSFLCIISLVLKKDNEFALYHGKQGLVLFVFETAAFILSVIPLLGIVMKTVGFAFFGLVSLWCMWQAFNGNRHRLPVISEIADQIIL